MKSGAAEDMASAQCEPIMGICGAEPLAGSRGRAPGAEPLGQSPWWGHQKVPPEAENV